MADCILSWNGQQTNYEMLFRDDCVKSYKIMTMEEFKKLKVTFSAQGWPKLNDKILKEFTHESFDMTESLPLF